jgi:hypothetical protein
MRIVRHKAMTVEALRERLKAAMAKVTTTRHQCSHCDGKGYVEKSAPMSRMDVERATGINNTVIGNFLKGKALSLAKGFQLMAWLEELERTAAADKLQLNGGEQDEQPRDPVVRERQAAAARFVQQSVSRASVSAAIDAINRPLNLRGGGAPGHDG